MRLILCGCGIVGVVYSLLSFLSLASHVFAYDDTLVTKGNQNNDHYDNTNNGNYDIENGRDGRGGGSGVSGIY